MPSSAFVIGYTGESGKALVKELIARKRFERLVLIGRKPAEDALPQGVEVKVIDFENLDGHKAEFNGFDQGFCCLGSTRAKHGVEGFLKVDRDYTKKVAEFAKEGGVKHYHLVSSMGAARGSNLYLNTKFETEEHACGLNFDRVSIYRPGMIMVDRVEQRTGEKFFRALMKPIAWCAPTWLTTPVEVIGKSMVSRSMIDNEPELPKEHVRLNIKQMFEWANKLPNVDA